MELEEAIKVVEEFLLILGSEYCYIDNRDTTKEEQALERVLKYIKEESISKAVVEEKIEEVRQLENASIADLIESEKEFCMDILEELLTKGE